ncbi:opacity protein-like surface antigen [Lewinella aquimaris]|uniref:Opacity protein-like surface antigen n=1 Tax=Neolewinella aquimaris TaxID=1835722 RepID=A0A840E2Q2_9BACT|nr:outer membrane beta-barrel protein [Neolewinella aquimaris]MBB4078002.1 opacity protein-like surface antigen [Neolewinella aquimaris]
MKSHLLFALLLLTLTLAAQDREGNVYLSGNTGLEYSKLGSKDASIYGYPTNLLQRFAGIRAHSFRSGYFLSNRFLLGARVDYINPTADPTYRYDYEGALRVKPFLRYYFLDHKSAPLSFFGELGFSTLGLGNATRFETDFHLGLGAELVVGPGVLGTANLNYDANADGVNYTNLVVGLNALTGQLQGAPTVASVRKGTFSSHGPYGRIAYGRNQSGINLTANFSLALTPRIGYFLLDGLMVEAAIDLLHNQYRVERDRANFNQGDLSLTDTELGVLLHYYPLRQGKVLPYVNAGWGYLELRQKVEGINGRFDETVSSPVWQAGVGALYFLSSQLALDLALNYNTGNASFKDGTPFVDGIQQRQFRGAVGLRFYLPAR